MTKMPSKTPKYLPNGNKTRPSVLNEDKYCERIMIVMTGVISEKQPNLR